MSHSSLDSPTEILRSTVLLPPYTPPPPTELSHERRLQWRENAKELMDATIDKWTYPSIPLTAIEDIRNSAKIAARLAKIWALAQSDPTQRDSANVKYHMECHDYDGSLGRFFLFLTISSLYDTKAKKHDTRDRM